MITLFTVDPAGFGDTTIVNVKTVPAGPLEGEALFVMVAEF
jgi:hypothetical protein